MSAVELRQASRLWDGEAGLHPIDLDVDHGQMVVVRGRSGSGKSTLLALVAGVCAPGTGRVLVLGQAPRLDMPWSELALVPQVLALSTELSIEENIADCGPARRIATAVRRSMEMLGMVELAGRTIGEVSMGQQQRVAVARAAVADPKVLLADEPTSFQDDAHTEVVVRALRSAADRGAAVLVATTTTGSPTPPTESSSSGHPPECCSQVGRGGGHDESIVSFGMAIKRMNGTRTPCCSRRSWCGRIVRDGRGDRCAAHSDSASWSE